MTDTGGFDFEAMAESIVDSADPIEPTFEEQLISDPEFENKRQTILDRVMDNPRRARKEKVSAPKPPKEKKALPRRSRGSLVKPLEELYTSLGMMFMPFDQVCATAVINSAPSCAKALDELAYQNEAVRRIVLSMIETSVWGQLIMAHAPILMAVAMHHIPAVRNGFAAMGGGNVANQAEEWLQHGNGDNS